MWDIEAYPNGDFGFSWFFFYSNHVPGWTQDQLEVRGHNRGQKYKILVD